MNEDTARCGAKKRNRVGDVDDDYCGLSAGFGTDHAGFGKCKFHGGNSPPHLKAAAKWQVTTEATRQLVKLGTPVPVDDPLSELARVTGEVVAWKDVMGSRVEAIAEEDWRYEHKNGEMLRAELILWERALDRCERFLTAMARLNIDERLAKIEEKQADAIINAIETTLRDMGMTLEQQEEARKGVARRLRAV